MKEEIENVWPQIAPTPFLSTGDAAVNVVQSLYRCLRHTHAHNHIVDLIVHYCCARVCTAHGGARESSRLIDSCLRFITLSGFAFSIQRQHGRTA